MVRSLDGFARNIDVSFKYAREDLNTLKMKSSFLQEKISELKKVDKEVRSDVSELKRLLKEKAKKEPVKPAQKKSVISSIKSQFFSKPKTKKKNPELQFYDVKAKKRFDSKDYKEVVKNKTLFSVAKSPFGNYESYRIIKKV